MPAFTCERCQKVFKQKGHYDSHAARKRPCKTNEALEKVNIAKVIENFTAMNIITMNPTTSDVKTGTKDIVKPFMKWVGGKTQIIHDVLSLFPPTIDDYYEPFLGGGSVLLALLTHIHNGTITLKGKIVASDLNAKLIALYRVIQAEPEQFITEVTKLTVEFSKCKEKANDTKANRVATTLEEALTSPEAYYFWIRSRYNALTDDEKLTVPASAMLLFMNKTGFRGVYREGPHGYNVPFGNYSNPAVLDPAHIREVSALIKDVVFRVAGFKDALAPLKTGDFVYMDPPYAPEDAKSFVGYTADGFDEEKHKELFSCCATLTTKNVKFLMSNASVKLVTDAFPAPAYTTRIINCRRSINSTNPEARTNELLITNL